MENSEIFEPLIIGKNISWESIKEQYFRVKHFTPFAIVEGDKLRVISTVLPYASLVVECPKVAIREASMPVVHKLDFRNLWEVFHVRGVSSEEEILVVYDPLQRRGISRLFSGVLPSLVIFLYPKGSLERINSNRKGPLSAEAYLNSLMPIATSDAQPENLK